MVSRGKGCAKRLHFDNFIISTHKIVLYLDSCGMSSPAWHHCYAYKWYTFIEALCLRSEVTLFEACLLAGSLPGKNILRAALRIAPARRATNHRIFRISSYGAACLWRFQPGLGCYQQGTLPTRMSYACPGHPAPQLGGERFGKGKGRRGATTHFYCSRA